MRIVAVACALMAFAAVSGPASAGDRLGVMKSFHGAQRILVLDDGSQYHVPDDVAVPIFRSGDKIRISAEERDGRKVVRRLSVAE
jgi:hypothetical protein